MINKQTTIYNAMNKLIYRTTIKQKWRKFKKNEHLYKHSNQHGDLSMFLQAALNYYRCCCCVVVVV